MLSLRVVLMIIIPHFSVHYDLLITEQSVRAEDNVPVFRIMCSNNACTVYARESGD